MIDEKKSHKGSLSQSKPTHEVHHLDEEATAVSLLAVEAERKKVLRKMDIHLLPFISILYLLSFL